MGAFLHNPGCNCCEEELTCDNLEDALGIYPEAELVLNFTGSDCSTAQCNQLDGTKIATLFSASPSVVIWKYEWPDPKPAFTGCSGAPSFHTALFVRLRIECSGINIIRSIQLEVITEPGPTSLWGDVIFGPSVPVTDTLVTAGGSFCDPSGSATYTLLP